MNFGYRKHFAYWILVWVFLSLCYANVWQGIGILRISFPISTNYSIAILFRAATTTASPIMCFSLNIPSQKSASFDTDLDQNFVVFFARPQLKDFAYRLVKMVFKKGVYFLTLQKQNSSSSFSKVFTTLSATI